MSSQRVRKTGIWATLAVLVTVLAARGIGGPPAACTGDPVTTGTFDTRILAAATGDVLCLDTGNYGEWHGTDKPITVRAGTGQTPQMTLLSSGDSGLTVDGLTLTGALIQNATDTTVKNATFVDSLVVEGSATDNVIIDHSTFNWPANSSDGSTVLPMKVRLDTTGSATVANPAVIFRNNEIKNGDLDGIKISGQGYRILNNTMVDLCDIGVNHTDYIQWDRTDDTREVRIARNYMGMTSPPPCASSQGVTTFDGGVYGAIVEDNVVDIINVNAIEFFSDRYSIIRHNTIRYRSPEPTQTPAGGINTDATCTFFNTSCGKMRFDNKDLEDGGIDDPPGVGTQVHDNITTGITIGGGSEVIQDHNLCRLPSGSGCSGTGTLIGAPTFVGGPYPTTYAGYCLASGSLGKDAASDGLDIGIRC